MRRASDGQDLATYAKEKDRRHERLEGCPDDVQYQVIRDMLESIDETELECQEEKHEAADHDL